MTDDPQFPSPKRRINLPARPKGAGSLTGKQDKLAKVAEALYTRARREGWTRKRFYDEINERPGLKGLRRDIKDNLIDHYHAPANPRLRKVIPPGYTPRSTYQENLMETLNYDHGQGFDNLDEDGAKSLIHEEDGGYQIYVEDESGSPYTS